jgi:hypothetical protein
VGQVDRPAILAERLGVIGGDHHDGALEVQRVEDIFRYQASLSIGAEWYPIRYLGIGAHAGLQWLNESYDSTAGNVIRDRSTTTWGTFRSGLELHFYFR